MDELGQHVKERLHAELDGAEPSPTFWHDLQARRRVHARRRTAGRVVAVAASVALLAVGGVALVGQLAPGPQAPPVAAQPDPAPVPATPTRIAQGTLGNGDTWTFDVAGPDAWPEARGVHGDLCVRIDISDGSWTANCAPPQTARMPDTNLHALYAMRNLPQARVIEFRYEDGAIKRIPMRLLPSAYGATWAIADLSDASPRQRFDGLAEIVILDPNGVELHKSFANDGVDHDGPPPTE